MCILCGCCFANPSSPSSPSWVSILCGCCFANPSSPSPSSWVCILCGCCFANPLSPLLPPAGCVFYVAVFLLTLYPPSWVCILCGCCFANPSPPHTQLGVYFMRVLFCKPIFPPAGCVFYVGVVLLTPHPLLPHLAVSMYV